MNQETRDSIKTTLNRPQNNDTGTSGEAVQTKKKISLSFNKNDANQ